STGTGFKFETWANYTQDGITLYGDRLVGFNDPTTVADVNGDGLDDLILSSGARPPIGPTGSDIPLEAYIYLSTGGSASGFVREPGRIDSFVGASDLTGDGIVDLIGRLPNKPASEIGLLSQGGLPDLLVSAKTPLGGGIDVTYAPSSAWPTDHRLPAVFQTVASITAKDGRGQEAVTDYSYAGGQWDYKERRFLGFETVTATLPLAAGESARPQIVTTYAQSIPSLGKPVKVERFDGAGNRLSRQEETYTEQNQHWPFTSLNTESRGTEYFYDAGGTASSSARKITRDFDEYGQVAWTYDHGHEATAADDRSSLTRYAENQSAYIVGLPRQQMTFEGIDESGVEDYTRLRDGELYFYDGNSSSGAAPTTGNLTKVSEWRGPSGNPNNPNLWRKLREMDYDSFGNVIEERNARNAPTTYTYETTFDLYPETMTNALGHVTTFDYEDRCGAPSLETDLNGQDTTTTYDLFCRPDRIDRSLGDYTQFAYLGFGDPDNQRIRISRPATTSQLAPQWQTYFDGLGRVHIAQSPGGQYWDPDLDRWRAENIRVLSEYDERGNLSRQSAPRYPDGALYWTTYTYDGLDRELIRTLPDASTIETSYLKGDHFRAVHVVDEIGREATIHLDAFERERIRERFDGATPVRTKMNYDVLDQMIEVRDPGSDGNNAQSAIWTYTYDYVGDRVATTDADLGSWTYAYDNHHRITEQIDSRGNRITFAYDDLDRQIRKRHYDAAGGLQETVDSAYDEISLGGFNIGLMTSQSNAEGTILSDYDALGRETTREWIVPGVSCDGDPTGRCLQITTYNALSLMTSVTYPDGSAVASPADPITYDPAGRLRTVPGLIVSEGNRATEYNARHQTIDITYANGLRTQFTYQDDRGWVMDIDTFENATGQTVYSKGYTRNAKGQILSTISSRANQAWVYTYDGLDRLVGADNLGDDSLDQTFTFALNGNMTFNSALGTYSYNGAQPHAPSQVGSAVFSYDAAGNMIVGLEGRVITYDAANRPESVTWRGQSSDYVYGPDGARIAKIADGQKTIYLGDIEITPQGRTIVHPHADVRLVDGLASYLHRDHLASVTVITDDQGATVTTRDFTPHGDMEGHEWV
ncbi:MAG: toxin TcdB middle/N-terminal domain-containing protein, partial [Pseudomonadota bacterium]